VRLKVYAGEARVLQGGQAQTVGRGRLLILDGVSVSGKFNDQTGDALYQWSRERSEFLAAASVSAARYVHGTGVSYASNSWVWTPSFRVYTLVPLNGTWQNSWGFRYYSPADAAIQISKVDSLTAEQQWRDAVAAASRQTDPCMTLH
jgi:hypothetical protein